MSDLLYTLSDGPFYESPENYKPDDSSVASSIFRDVLPSDWRLRHHGIWLIAEPPLQNLPASGFKIHVSTRPEYREGVIRTCTQTSVEFNSSIKCFCDSAIWRKLHDKPYAAEFPLSYGKAITIYPETTEIFNHIASKLASELQGFSGPDLITDRPVLNSKTVYYRYGPFLTPDEEIDDDRNQPFSLTLPDLIPPTLSSEIRTASSEIHTTDEAPHPIDKYDVQYAIQTGIYVAETQDGETVVIKEAAEDACVDADGKDAAARLLSELAILHSLSDANADITPKPIDSFKMWRNFYVVMQHLPGSPLTELHRKRIPLQKRLEIAASLAEALAKVHDNDIVWGDVSPTNVLWEQDTNKVYLVDFELGRKLTQKPQKTPAGTPGFTATRPKKSYRPSFKLQSLLWIDRQSDVHPSGLYHYGLRLLFWTCYALFYPIKTVRRGRGQFLTAIRFNKNSRKHITVETTYHKKMTSDVHGLGFLLLYIFVAPVNAMFDLDPAAPHRFLNAMRDQQLVTVIEDCLNPENDTTAKSVADTLRAIEATPTDVPTNNSEIPNTYRKTLNDILTFIKAHITFDRQDRLFPCSPDGFAAPISMAYGATGLAYLLRAIGGEDALVEKTLDWIFAHPDFSDEEKLEATPGYWSGTAGLATTLSRSIETDTAKIFIETATRHIHTTDESNRYDGIAGVADASLTLYKNTNDAFFINTAQNLADQLIAQAVAADTHDPTRIWRSPDDDAIYPGYLFGVAGIADFLLELAAHLETDKQQYTDIAERALLWVEEQTIVAEDGSLATPITAGGDTYARNLAHGNAGVAKAFLSARQHFGSDKDDFIRQLLLPNDTNLPAFSHTPAPGHFYGLSGIGEVLLDAFAITGETAYLKHAHNVLKDLLCFQVTDPHGEGIGFPGGENLKRLSCDFATGSLGVAHFIHHFLKAADSDNIPVGGTPNCVHTRHNLS